MDRRQIVFLIAGIAGMAAIPCAFAQQPKIRRIGYLAARSRSTAENPDVLYDAFLAAMRELGYVEGRNLVIEWRFANNQYELLPALARELVDAKVEVIVSHSTPGTQAVKQATRTIPIVMHGNDPVAAGIVASLARPEGNITGLSLTVADATPKQVELLKMLLPQLSRAAILVNPQNASHPEILKNFRASAAQARIRVLPVYASRPEELEPAFAAMTRDGAEAVLVASDSFFTSHKGPIANLALKYRLPSLVGFREDVKVGGLMAYALDVASAYGHAATYVDKILKGAKPADLPIEQATRFDLIINLKTAKALGLTVPKELVLRAHEVMR